ncbi:hypothetical protein JYU34_001499 [Plutella xylostella]|uniref:Uncharacterized protein n=1 Tax=Plutella xylostella TaxID=51655 RepID=A0ABQ7R429_PLUXY|nr:hypothetical protein JYU34_001499 [Plutella xylostella]
MTHDMIVDTKEQGLKGLVQITGYIYHEMGTMECTSLASTVLLRVRSHIWTVWELQRPRRAHASTREEMCTGGYA